jgi:hypothetical protein
MDRVWRDTHTVGDSTCVSNRCLRLYLCDVCRSDDDDDDDDDPYPAYAGLDFGVSAIGMSAGEC